MTLAVAVATVAAAAAVIVWMAGGDDRAHLVETERSAPTTVPAPPTDQDSTVRADEHSEPLIVALGGLDESGRPTTSESASAETTIDRNGPTTTATSPTSPDASTSAAGTEPGTPVSSAVKATGSEPGPVGDTAGGHGASVVEATTTARVETTATTGAPTSSTSRSSTAPAAGVVWEEHFTSLDTGRWRLEHSTYGDGNGERQCYRPENVDVANGRLVLTARSETYTCPNGSTRSVTSGMVRSRGLSFSPGQAIEFRVRLTPSDPDNQAGLWPAVWASSWAGSWPRGGELDFLEVMTAESASRAVFSVHYADASGRHELQNKAVRLPNYFSNGWRTVRFDYGRNGTLAWYLDGARVFTVSDADTLQGYPAPFDQTIDEIKINLAVGGRPGPLADGVLGSSGATFEVDYVRVFNL